MAALVDALCASSVVDNAASALVYDTFNAASAAGVLFDNAAAFCDGAGVVCRPTPVVPQEAPGAGDVATAPGETSSVAPPRRKRRRRARSCKSMEETECQRMTHIAVERNRRRQMNEYLVMLRSLMPESYVQRGDQASIVGGAIDFVKELEQQLQSLEAQKRGLSWVHHQQQHKAMRDSTMPTPTPTTYTAAAPPCVESTSNCSSSVTESDACDSAAPFAGFFAYPQYVWCHSPRDSATALSAEESRAGVADIEVSLVETHASLRVMSPRRPGQLLRMVAGLQALRLTVLHLNVTALDALVLYSLSVKVEEGCGLATADDIAAAVHHVLCFIHAEAEAASQQQLLAAAQ